MPLVLEPRLDHGLLVDGGRDDPVQFPRHREVDRLIEVLDRGPPALRGKDAWWTTGRVDVLQVEYLQQTKVSSRLARGGDGPHGEVQVAEADRPPHDPGLADDKRAAGGPHFLVGQGLGHDLRTNPRRISNRQSQERTKQLTRAHRPLKASGS